MKRTIKRHSREMNEGKWRTVAAIAASYARQKDSFLLKYGPASMFGQYRGERQARDELVAAGYESPLGLQGRQWKLALKDAFETIERQWLALAERLRPLVIAQRKQGRFMEEQAHYAFWVLKSARRMAQLVGDKAPTPEHFEIEENERRQAVVYLRRVIRRERGADPRVKNGRSFALDAEMYSVFEQNGKQYIRVMTLRPRERVVIPLTGQGELAGNLRVVLDDEKRRVEIHRAVDVRKRKAQGEPLAVDLGVTEMLTDSDGDRWGEEQGKLLATYSDQVCDKGRRRNKVRSVQEKQVKKGNLAKARRIEKYNLGTQKRRRQRGKMRQTMACQVNRALNALQEAKDPELVVHEDLRGIGGKFKSKRLNRIVSTWARGLVKDRLSFKASAGGSRREQVNPSYSSQMCPRCGFVHYKNRQGDRFQCLFCGHGGDSDTVAARNLLERLDDPDIRLWTPKERVKAILLSRFHRRVESWDFPFSPAQANLVMLVEVGITATVPGRTREPATSITADVSGIRASQSESETPAVAIRQRGTDLGRFV